MGVWVVLFMGVMGAFLWFLVGVFLTYLLGGILTGVVVFYLGARWQKSPLALAKSPRLLPLCHKFGIAAAVVNGLALLVNILRLVVSVNSIGTTMHPLWIEACGWSSFFGFLLFQVMGVLLICLSRINKNSSPPVVSRVLPIVCLLLGIITLLMGLVVFIGLIALIYSAGQG